MGLKKVQRNVKSAQGFKVKKITEIIHQITGARIVFCYGAKSYHKYIRKQFNTDEYIIDSGVCTAWNEKEFIVVVGVKKSRNIYALKALIVHELSHAVTMLFNNYNFDCDELRSYTLQYIYQEIMPPLDEILLKDSIKKDKKAQRNVKKKT